MRYALILLSLCILSHSAPALANAGAVCDGRELSDGAILRILLKDSKIKLDSNRKKVVEYSLKLTKKRNPPLTAKEKREIKNFLLPNRDEVSRWTLSDGRLRNRFKDVYEHCLADILRGHPDITGRIWVTAGNVADMLIP